MRKFTPPFKIVEPLNAEQLAELEIPGPDTWDVVDSDYLRISTHKTKESAERGLEAANRNLIPAKGEASNG